MGGDGKKTVKTRVKDRFKEPSTYAAIASMAAVAAGVPPQVVSGAAGALQSPEGQAAVLTAIVAGVLGVLLPEKK